MSDFSTVDRSTTVGSLMKVTDSVPTRTGTFPHSQCLSHPLPPPWHVKMMMMNEWKQDRAVLARQVGEGERRKKGGRERKEKKGKANRWLKEYVMSSIGDNEVMMVEKS